MCKLASNDGAWFLSMYNPIKILNLFKSSPVAKNHAAKREPLAEGQGRMLILRVRLLAASTG